jgi:hypothetical protein
MIKDFPEKDDDEVVMLSNDEVQQELFEAFMFHSYCLAFCLMLTIILAAGTLIGPNPDVKQQAFYRKIVLFFLYCTILFCFSLVLHPFLCFNKEVSRWIKRNKLPHRVRICQGGTLIVLGIFGIFLYVSQI